jgi:hypothetical protein
MESQVGDPEATLASFNRQFGLNSSEKGAVDWAWPHEMGNTMFNVVKHLHQGSTDGWVDRGVEFQVVAGWREYIGDAQVGDRGVCSI